MGNAWKSFAEKVAVAKMWLALLVIFFGGLAIYYGAVYVRYRGDPQQLADYNAYIAVSYTHLTLPTKRIV